MWSSPDGLLPYYRLGAAGLHRDDHLHNCGDQEGMVLMLIWDQNLPHVWWFKRMRQSLRLNSWEGYKISQMMYETQLALYKVNYEITCARARTASEIQEAVDKVKQRGRMR
jgi:hypothetical protein